MIVFCELKEMVATGGNTVGYSAPSDVVVAIDSIVAIRPADLGGKAACSLQLKGGHSLYVQGSKLDVLEAIRSAYDIAISSRASHN